MRSIALAVTFVVISSTLRAGGDNSAAGARQAALGGAGVAMVDIWSVHHNQAGLARLEEATAGVSNENRFFLEQLGLRSFAAALPVGGGGTFGLAFSSFGYELFSESKTGIAYARMFGSNIAAGVQMDYLHTRIGNNYGKRGLVAAEAGLQYMPLKNLWFGAHLFNPWRAAIFRYELQGSSYEERVPAIMRMGMQYAFSRKVAVLAEAEKGDDTEPLFRAGVEYRPADLLFLRMGVVSDPGMYSFGAGLQLGNFSADLAASVHPVLGITPHISLSYRLTRRKTGVS